MTFTVGDIVIHGKYGVGVVLTSGPTCQVRFYDGKGQIDPKRLKLLRSVRLAGALAARSLSTWGEASDLLRGAVLWLRSDDPELSTVAVKLLAAPRSPDVLLVTDRCVAELPSRARDRARRLFTRERVALGLDSWEAAVERAKEAEATAPSVTPVPASRLATENQIATISGIRYRLQRPALSASERKRVEQAVAGQLLSPFTYKNHCWKCGTPLTSKLNPHCHICGWLVCLCGACRQPTYVGGTGGRSGPCPQEARLLEL